MNRQWIAAGELRDYLVFRGFRANLVHGTLDDARPVGLLRMLETGIPVIVERELWGANHFQVVCGFEASRHLVLVMSPEGVAAVPYEKFEKSWAAADHLMLVAVPESKIALQQAPGG